MTELFSDSYAATYDAVYDQKNYAAECESVERLIAKFGIGKHRKLLDLGCGTGKHALIFARHGFEVTGVDQSMPMVTRARAQAKQQGFDTNPEFLTGDVRSFSIKEKFDAAVMNFNVIGYMSRNDDVLSALGSARRQLREHGLLVADFWYGPAVMADPPGENRREFRDGDVRVVRSSLGRHLPDAQCCDISIRITRLSGERVIDEVLENHRVRYFFPLEIELLLRMSGFQLTALTGFPDVESDPGPGKWAAAVVATAI